MEPATMSDVKELMKDLLKECRESIKEAVAEAFGNSKPALEHATTSNASQLLTMDASDAKVPAPACSSPDQGTSAFDLAPTATIDILSELDVDTTGVAAPTHVTCSTECSPKQPIDVPVLVASSPSTLTEYDLNTSNISVAAVHPAITGVFLAVLAPSFQLLQLYIDCELFRQSSSRRITSKIPVLRPMPWPSFMDVLADGDGTRPPPWLWFMEVNGVASDGERGACVDGNSVNVIPFSVVPVLSIMADTHIDSTPSPMASNWCSAYCATAVPLSASPRVASIILHGQYKYDMVHLVNIFHVGLKSLKDMELFWNLSWDQNNAHPNCYTLASVLVTTRSCSGYELLTLAFDWYVGENEHQLSTGLDAKRPSHGVTLRLGIAYGVLRLLFSVSTIISAVAVCLEDGIVAASLHLNADCTSFVCMILRRILLCLNRHTSFTYWRIVLSSTIGLQIWFDHVLPSEVEHESFLQHATAWEPGKNEGARTYPVLVAVFLYVSSANTEVHGATATGNSCVCVQELQLARSGTEDATLNNISISMNHCRLKWSESSLAHSVDMAVYCSSFSCTSGGTICENIMASTTFSFAWANLICFSNSEVCALLVGFLRSGARIQSDMSRDAGTIATNVVIAVGISHRCTVRSRFSTVRLRYKCFPAVYAPIMVGRNPSSICAASYSQKNVLYISARGLLFLQNQEGVHS